MRNGVGVKKEKIWRYGIVWWCGLRFEIMQEESGGFAAGSEVGWSWQPPCFPCLESYLNMHHWT